MTISVKYDATAAKKVWGDYDPATLIEDMLAARTELLEDVDLFNSGDPVPADKQPLDAGFIEWPQKLLFEYQADQENSLVGRIIDAAEMLQEEVDRVILLGIGGSYMGARACFEAMCHPHHNEMPADFRDGVPRISFQGHNVDNDATAGLLELLEVLGDNPAVFDDRWALVPISKSGGTLETAVAFRLYREALEEFYGKDTDEVTEFVIPVTGEKGKLRDLSEVDEYPVTFPIPDGIGGRFSVFTAVGLLPAAIMGLDIVKMLEGAAAMTRKFKSGQPGHNPVFDYTVVCKAFEDDYDMPIRLLSTWGLRLEAFGFWHDQLLSESLGKDEKGATPLTVVNTRDLHSRGQQHQEGQRDKLITNLIIGGSQTDDVTIPESDRDQDHLNRFAGKSLNEVMSAAIQGTNQAYAGENRPTADLTVPELNETTLGELFQFFMLSTVLEGRYMDVNPYGQPGVEAYKQNMNRILES
ncbi:MAG: glucose-6-phosphate isomerase [Planctomycetaceae bacterium]|jgi:glucose-6-phosphate isomerase|nr:glucose-6-phosphate isomerase [Planctomycetaceae bacterium]